MLTRVGRRLLNRIIESSPKRCRTLETTPVSFEREGYLGGAEVFYKRAIEADPKTCQQPCQLRRLLGPERE